MHSVEKLRREDAHATDVKVPFKQGASTAGNLVCMRTEENVQFSANTISINVPAVEKYEKNTIAGFGKISLYILYRFR